MIIVGSDYHPSFQQIAFVDTETGELKEQRLAHQERAEEFYRALAATGDPDSGQLTKNLHNTHHSPKGRPDRVSCAFA